MTKLKVNRQNLTVNDKTKPKMATRTEIDNT